MSAAKTPTAPDAAELIRRSQEAARTITDAYTTAVREAFAALPAFPTTATLPTAPPTADDAVAAVDGFYAYATKAVAIQRDFVKSVASIATV